MLQRNSNAQKAVLSATMPNKVGAIVGSAISIEGMWRWALVRRKTLEWPVGPFISFASIQSSCNEFEIPLCSFITTDTCRRRNWVKCVKIQKFWYEQKEIFLSIHPSLPSPQLNSKAESLVFVRGQDCPGLRDRDDEEGHRHQEPHLLSTDRK